ncbi:MAG: cytochrome-c peroxidase [Bacteroidetes bacterium]|nr:cytochrome-c peroxidase [Bacteroidota bacterium]MBL6943891.1 cytochrome-c peroxidase [Bacteroidales bacterium]
MKYSIIIAVSLFALLISGCEDKPVPTPHITTPYEIEIPFGFPTKLNIPEDNPMTVEGIELGRYLFYDGRMSGRIHPDSLMSCATCHIQANSFECGINHPEYIGGFTHGITGKPTPHVMLPMINLVWNSYGYLWNGLISDDNPNQNFRNIEDLVWMGIVAEHEMNSDTNLAKETIQNIQGYPELFKKAFDSETVTMKNMSRAIAQFVRTLISANSKFDRYMQGEVQLTQSELNGYVLFTTEEGADCFHCHGGFGNPLFTTHLYYNNGKDTEFTDPRDRFAITGDPMDHGAYKAPTLRNIEVQGPYMHDGRFATLEEVIDFYSHNLQNSPYINPLMHHINNGGIQLTPTEKEDLLNFIKTLRDDDFIMNEKFSAPDKFPDEI